MRLPTQLTSSERSLVVVQHLRTLAPSTLFMLASFSQSQLAQSLNIQLPFLIREHYRLPPHIQTPDCALYSSTGSTIASLRASLRAHCKRVELYAVTGGVLKG
jgi:hypothetical protein